MEQLIRLLLNKKIILIGPKNELCDRLFKLFTTHHVTMEYVASIVEGIKATEAEVYDLIFVVSHVMSCSNTSIYHLNNAYKNIPIIRVEHDLLDSTRPCRISSRHTNHHVLLSSMSDNQMLNTIAHAIHEPPKILKQSISLLDWLHDAAQLDVESGLVYCGHLEDLYIELLEEFLLTHRHDLKRIAKAYWDNDMNAIMRLIHTLSSLLNTLGIVTIHKPLLVLETALKNNEIKQIDYGDLIFHLEKDFEYLIIILSYLFKHIRKEEII